MAEGNLPESGPYTSVASCSISREILFPASATLLNIGTKQSFLISSQGGIDSVDLGDAGHVFCFLRSKLRRLRQRTGFLELGHQRREQRRIGLPAAQAADIHRLSYLGAAHRAHAAVGKLSVLSPPLTSSADVKLRDVRVGGSGRP